MRKRKLQSHSVMLLRRIHSTRSDALAFPSASNITTSSWFSLGLVCPRVSSEITVEVILCKYSRRRQLACLRWRSLLQVLANVSASPGAGCWAEAPIKIARMTLTIKLDGNWSSFQLANNTPPLSVTGSVIAPSARMAPTGAKALPCAAKVSKAMFLRLCGRLAGWLAGGQAGNRNIACGTLLLPASGPGEPWAYLLGLLAMIKCSICSYQCDN